MSDMFCDLTGWTVLIQIAFVRKSPNCFLFTQKWNKSMFYPCLLTAYIQLLNHFFRKPMNFDFEAMFLHVSCRFFVMSCYLDMRLYICRYRHQQVNFAQVTKCQARLG
jgi:hypothetical protein